MDKKIQIILLVFLIFIDQLSKYLFFISVKSNFNLGISFGFGKNFLSANLISLFIFSLLLLLFFLLKKQQLWHWSLVFFFAGGISNLIDRVIFGGVKDFLPFLSLSNNLADYFIIIGLVIFIYDQLSNHLSR